jgi:SMC domain protein
MYLKRVEVRGYRASAKESIECELNGRFSLILGANGSGKTTINEAIAFAHPRKFPRFGPIDASALGGTPRSVCVKYEFENDPAREGALGKFRKRRGLDAPGWCCPLERSLGQVRAGRPFEAPAVDDNIRLVYLPALRNPVDDLSRRDTRILLELLRADERQQPSTGGLRSLRALAEKMLSTLTRHPLVENVEERITENLRIISGGVQEHHAFIGTQTVDDTYLARVFEMLIALLSDRDTARRLQVSSLGYVNLLHIAVTLAGIPDPTPEVQFAETMPRAAMQLSELNNTSAEAARERLRQTDEAADADADSFYPELFHATVLLEEPEAHLHPQLQYGLIRYLRRLVRDRPDIQIIVTTHSVDLAAACDPEEIVVVRKDSKNRTISRSVIDIPLQDKLKNKLLQQTRLHLDATRSAALFADRLLVVEGITEANILRLLGRAWAGNEEMRIGFIDSLAILPVGHKIGEWPVRLLATPGYEFVTRIALLADTDLRGTPIPDPKAPDWHSELDPASARFFWSQPTLEPSIVEGNEKLIEQTFEVCCFGGLSEITVDGIDEYFGKNRKCKSEFALALINVMDENLDDVVVPKHINEMFTWLFDGLESEGF